MRILMYQTFVIDSLIGWSVDLSIKFIWYIIIHYDIIITNTLINFGLSFIEKNKRSGSEVWIVRTNLVNIIAGNYLAPGVASTSTAIELTLYDRRTPVCYKDILLLCW